jgi:hypothetical protein
MVTNAGMVEAGNDHGRVAMIQSFVFLSLLILYAIPNNELNALNVSNTLLRT